ncbi:MAG: PAS domain S-box protein [Deltaproteobacteria bacterium]
MSLRRKLTIMFLAVALIPVLFVSVLTFHHYEDYLEADKLSELRNIAVFKADKIETCFRDLKIYFELTQVVYVVKKNLPILTQLASDPANPEFVAAKSMIDEVYRDTPLSLGLIDVMLTNPQGRVVYSSNPEHFPKEFLNFLPGPLQKAFNEGKNKIYFSDIFFNKTHNDKPAMLITGPALDFNGNFIGVIAAEVDMSPIYKIIQDATGLGNTGETLIGRKIGNKVIFLNPLRHDPEAALKKTIEIGDKIGRGIQDAVQGKTGAGKFIDYRGKQAIGAWRYIPFLDWGIVAKIDEQEAFIDIANLRNLITIILVIISVLGGIMSLSIAQSISGPIKELSKGVEIIGSGNFDYKVDTGLKDEIGQLSRAFDKMTAEQKLAQERLSSAGQYARSLLEASLDPLVTISAEGKITDVNEATIRATGRTRQELIGTDFSSYFTEPEKAQASYRQDFDKGFVIGYPLTMCHKDGKLMDVLYNATVYRDGRGNAIGVFAAARDVTLLKQTEAELRRHRDSLEALVQERTVQLRESEKDLKRAQAVAHIGSWRLEVRQNKLDWSEEVYRMFDIPKETPMTYETFLARVHPEDREFVDKSWKKALTGGRYDIEHRIVVGDEVKWVQEQAELEFDEKGTLLGGFGTVQDVTERKKIEEKILREKQFSDSLINSLPGVFYAIDTNGKFLVINRKFPEVMGYSMEDMLKIKAVDLFSGEERKLIEERIKEVFERGEATAEAHLLSKSGENPLYYFTGIRIVRDDIPILIGMGINITERKEAEEQLKRSNENLEQFAYVASHDLQEPLRVMASYSQLLEKRYKDKLDDDAKDFIGFIVDAANRMQRLITDLLAYSRVGRKDITTTEVDFDEVVNKVIYGMSSIIEASGGEVTHDKLPVLTAHETSIMQVFQNLIANALKFRGEKAPRIHISARKDKDEWIFSVADNGLGIDPQYHERIFQIFQRLHSREKYSGTGIGLSICKKIVLSYGGKIWVESEAGKGSIFYFTIPT